LGPTICRIIIKGREPDLFQMYSFVSRIPMLGLSCIGA